MKLILFILTVSLSSSFCKAQLIDHWKRISDDSVAFAQVFGSVTEYNYQYTYRHSNRHNFKIHFIGSRPYYITEVAEWLGQEGLCGNTFWTNDDEDDYFECGSDGCPPSSMGDYKRVPLTIRAYVSKKNRITSVKISGDAHVLIKLFLHYWEDATTKIDRLKKGGEVYQDNMDDRITFSWRGDTPVITITKNPNMTFFERNIPMD